MPPQVPLLLGTGFACWLIHLDMRWRRLPSPALWIAILWLAMSGSRQLSFWISVGFGVGDQTSNLEGSPINVVFNSVLFIASILVLGQRGFSWGKFSYANKALVASYAFFLCSMLWSPFPVPTLKRVIQDFGSVLIGLIVLTERDPSASLRVVFARVSYVLFPLSVVFIRYFPEIGRFVSSVSGTHMLCGVTGHKNLLGQMTMVFCLVSLWDVMETRNQEATPRTKPERWARPVNLSVGLYLLFISESATSLICFLLGVILLFKGRRLAQIKNAGRVYMISVLAIVCLFALEQALGISSRVSETLDRGSGLSGRTEIWRVTLEKNKAYLVGNGFRGFWETSEGESVSQELSSNLLLTAHNGYLDTYLNGGLVGLILLVALIFSMGVNASHKLVTGDPIGRLAVLFWPIALIYNVTESAFFQFGSLWFTILLVTMISRWQNGSVEAFHP